MVARRTKYILALCIVAVIVSVVGYFARTMPAGEPSLGRERQQQSQEANKSTRKVITLPGASSIPLVYQDIAQDSSIWVVVSKKRALSDPAYTPTELVTPRVATNTSKTAEEQSLRPEAARALESMLTKASDEGHQLFMASGFRSYELQKMYYDNYVRSYGVAEADTFSAKPGYSEHQTGLAFDLAPVSRECYLEICFEDQPSGIWLAKNAPSYGFILRYPKDKSEITGYMYEPWHFRFVGTELSGALTQSGLTLDEAYQYIVDSQ